MLMRLMICTQLQFTLGIQLRYGTGVGHCSLVSRNIHMATKFCGVPGSYEASLGFKSSATLDVH